jgi:hypothetical protein
MLDKNSNTTEITRAVRTKVGVDETNPYPWLFGTCWALLNETQRKTLAKIINEKEDK